MSKLLEISKPYLRRIKEASPQTRDARILSWIKTASAALAAFIAAALKEEFVMVTKQFVLDFFAQISEVPIVFGFSLFSFLGLVVAFMSRQELHFRLVRMKPEDFIFVRSRLVDYVGGAWNVEVSVMNNHPDDEISITCNELVLARAEREHRGIVSGLSTVQVQPKHAHVFRFSVPCGDAQFSASLRYTVHVGSKALPEFNDEVLRLIRV